MSGSILPAVQYLDLVAQDLWLCRGQARESLEELALHLDNLPHDEAIVFPAIVARMGDPQVLAQQINNSVGWWAWDIRWFALTCVLTSLVAFIPVLLTAWATYPERMPHTYGIELLGFLLGQIEIALWRVLRWTCQRSMPGAWTYASGLAPALLMLIGFQVTLWNELLRNHASALHAAWDNSQTLKWDNIAICSGGVLLMTVVGFVAAAWERRQAHTSRV